MSLDATTLAAVVDRLAIQDLLVRVSQAYFDVLAAQDTLAFSVLTGVRSMSEVYPLERAAEAYERMMSGKARFRVVLTTAPETS